MSEAHKSSAWKRLSKQRLAIAAARDEPCCRCGGEIDYTLPGNRRLGPTVDHRVPVAITGEVEVLDIEHDLGPAHRHCNSRHGQRISAHRRRTGTVGRAPRAKKAQQTASTVTQSDHFSDSGTQSAPTGIPYPKQGRGVTLREGVNASERPLQGPGNGTGAPTMPSPRYLSEPHPRRAGSMAPEALEWITRRRAEDPLVPEDEVAPLPAWEVILDRALEVDDDGVLLWKVVVFSVPRQSTKSTVVSELCAWRTMSAERFKERQSVVMISNKLQSALRVQQDLYHWAKLAGLRVNKRTGAEKISDPQTESFWELASLNAIYGSRSSLVVIDEAHAVDRAAVERAVLPSQARRRSAQTWLVSTANDGCTDLMPTFRRLAVEQGPASGVCLCEWGAVAGEDVSDPAVWAASNPHPTPEYLEAVARNRGSADFLGQWLNVWPELEESTVPTWLPEVQVAACGRRTVDVAATAGAVEVDVDGSWAAAAGDDTRVTTFTGSMAGAVAFLHAAGAPVVLGHSAALQQLPQGQPWQHRAVTATEFSAAAGLLADAVAQQDIAWDNAEAVGAQLANVVVIPADGGVRIAARASRGPVGLPKAISLIRWWSRVHRAEEPQIW